VRQTWLTSLVTSPPRFTRDRQHRCGGRAALPGTVSEESWKAWLEAEGRAHAAELDRLAEKAIEVANQRVEGLTRAIADDLSSPEARLHISVDTFRYDASVFALGALGTTILLFVNTLAGGLMTLAPRSWPLSCAAKWRKR